jgi:3-phenylpropionate/cinnamic acid dioxygenase small subunit
MMPERAGDRWRLSDGITLTVRERPGYLLPTQSDPGKDLSKLGGERNAEVADVSDTASDLARLLLKEEVESFLYHEAELLDERRYEEWLDLFTPDLHYWMPMRRNVPRDEPEREYTRHGTDVNWFDEGKDTLTRRVRQVLTGVHWAEEPPSRICHIVSNVQILHTSATAATPAEIGVKSRFIVYRNRVETETDFLVGKREDLLRRADGGLQIARRKIILDQNVLLAKNLTVFF